MKKQSQSKVVGVELRAGGGLHGPEKPGRSASDMEKQPENEMKNNNNKMKNKNECQQNEEQKWMNDNNKKNPAGSPKQSTIAGSFCSVDFRLKKWLQKCY